MDSLENYNVIFALFGLNYLYFTLVGNNNSNRNGQLLRCVQPLYSVSLRVSLPLYLINPK